MNISNMYSNMLEYEKDVKIDFHIQKRREMLENLREYISTWE